MPSNPENIRAFEKAGWDRAAAAYEQSFATATRQFIEPLLEEAGIVSGARVLDLCCGPGFAGAEAAARGALVTGLDFSPSMLAEAWARFPAISFDHADAEAPPYEDESFDSVICNFGVHHVPRPAVAVTQVHRILRHGAKFAFSIWAGQAENVAWRLVFDAVDRHGDLGAARAPVPGGGFATSADCLRVLAEAGFSATTAQLVRGTWRHRDGASLLAALRAGTARMAAMIEAQSDAAMPAILAAIETAAVPWRLSGTDGIALPIACIIAAGTRP